MIKRLVAKATAKNEKKIASYIQTVKGLDLIIGGKFGQVFFFFFFFFLYILLLITNFKIEQIEQYQYFSPDFADAFSGYLVFCEQSTVK